MCVCVLGDVIWYASGVCQSFCRLRLRARVCVMQRKSVSRGSGGVAGCFALGTLAHSH